MHWNVAQDALPGSATFVRVLDHWRNDCTFSSISPKQRRQSTNKIINFSLYTGLIIMFSHGSFDRHNEPSGLSNSIVSGHSDHPYRLP